METDLSFVAPEGVYTVAEELIYPPNALPLFPTSIASVAVRFPARQQGTTPAFAQLLGARPRDRDDAGTNSDLGDPDDASTPDSAPDLFAHPAKKRSTARPRHNIKNSSSTFITRIQTAEGLSKTLQSKQGDATFIFYNLAKCFVWVEAGAKSKVRSYLVHVLPAHATSLIKEPLSKITFSAYPTCHDVNLYTASPEHFDVIIGFVTGDLVWLGESASDACIYSSVSDTSRQIPYPPDMVA